MAKLRKACAYRRLQTPYTRTSKYRELSFVRVRPASKVVRYEMGSKKRKYGYTLNLLSKADFNLRHNAIESARLSSNRLLEGKLGKTGYFLKIRTYPHHIMRENPLAAGAGADRMSTGMKMSFGKPIGVAARVRKGQVIMSLNVAKQNLPLAREALKRFYNKIPCSCWIEIVENK